MTELITKAYIPVHAETSLPIGDGIIFKEPLKGMQHDELVSRKEAETAIAKARDERNERETEIEALRHQLILAEGKVDGWKESARHFSSGQDFYQGLIWQMGAAIGRRAYTSDDGSVQHDPLALVVRDIVVAAYKPQNRLVRAWRMLVRGF